jgi:hypothetical protein
LDAQLQGGDKALVNTADRRYLERLLEIDARKAFPALSKQVPFHIRTISNMNNNFYNI